MFLFVKSTFSVPYRKLEKVVFSKQVNFVVDGKFFDLKTVKKAVKNVGELFFFQDFF